MRKFLGALLAALLPTSLLSSCSGPVELRVLCSNDERICNNWATEYAAQTGQKVRFLRLPTSAALARIRSLRTRPEFDVWVGGPAENYELAQTEGLLAPTSLPASRQIPSQFKARNGSWYGVYGSVLAICANPTELARKKLRPPQSWRQLSQKQYSGVISAASPRSSGTALSLIQTIEMTYRNPKDILTGIYNNVGRFTNSGTAPASAIASRQGALAISFTPYCRAQSLEVIYPSEGTTYEIGAGALLAKSPHPKRGRAFLNWLLSPPGQRAGEVGNLKQAPTNATFENSLAKLLANPHLKIVSKPPPEPRRSATNG